MNKILVNNDEVTLLDTDDSIIVTLSDKFDIYDIVKIKIQVLKDTEIEIEYKSENESKLDVSLDINKNTNLKLLEIRNGNDIKIQYHYYLASNANVEVDKFYCCNKVKELDVINLNGIGANINYNFKTICKNNQNYDLMIYHNYENTISNIINKGINVENGTLNFNVTSIVYKGKINCEVDQNSRIINFNENKCSIKPILLIDEADVIANHAALIGKFSDEELFYLQSRGINYKDAINLLVRGFLLDGMDNNKKVDKIINDYWR